MSRSTLAESHNGNYLISALPDGHRERLWPQLEHIDLEIKHVLYEPYEPITYVYFIQTGVGSMLQMMDDGSAVEVGTVGNEGMIGIPVFLGATSTPGQAIIQVPGQALRMSTENFLEEVNLGGPLARIINRYTQSLFVQIAQSTACNRLHNIEQRCARWMLMTRERVESDRFPLTQEFLGQMLGVSRASVNAVARQLQEAGLITYTRGVITILDRVGLEALSCECYGVIRDEYARMLAQLQGLNP